MSRKGMNEIAKNWIGAGVMAAAAAVLITGSGGIYGELSRIGRPVSDTPIYTPGVYGGESRGYAGPVSVQVEVTDREILSIRVSGEKETPGVGGKALNDLPLLMLRSQSAEVDAVSGATQSSAALKRAVNEALALARGEEPEKAVGQENVLEGVVLADGEYSYEDEEYDSNGFKNVISLTVENGAVISCGWDAVNEAGDQKSRLSMEGAYVMSESGLPWAEQAEALAEYVTANQGVYGLADDEGYTDAVAGVSINIAVFVNGVEDCMKQAAGM